MLQFLHQKMFEFIFYKCYDNTDTVCVDALLYFVYVVDEVVFCVLANKVVRGPFLAPSCSTPL